MQQIKDKFQGQFLVGPEELERKLAGIKAFVFDWDGVFNSGVKDEQGSSSFNEVDSMAINMLRFNYYLRTGSVPVTGVISGEKNSISFQYAEREHFHSVYYKILYKVDALHHLCNRYNIVPGEVAFFYDDILDMAPAALCGLRIMVGRPCNPLFTELVKEKQLADYITTADGGHYAIREAAELLLGLTGQYKDTVLQRSDFSADYQKYLKMRNEPKPAYYTTSGSVIKELRPQ
ncbi:MAG: phosphatase [Bacteroidetes bacterium]|nr:phosphatase [Bacteroidota bacterium]